MRTYIGCYILYFGTEPYRRLWWYYEDPALTIHFTYFGTKPLLMGAFFKSDQRDYFVSVKTNQAIREWMIVYRVNPVYWQFVESVITSSGSELRLSKKFVPRLLKSTHLFKALKLAKWLTLLKKNMYTLCWCNDERELHCVQKVLPVLSAGNEHGFAIITTQRFCWYMGADVSAMEKAGKRSLIANVHQFV